MNKPITFKDCWYLIYLIYGHTDIVSHRFIADAPDAKDVRITEDDIGNGIWFLSLLMYEEGFTRRQIAGLAIRMNAAVRRKKGGIL